jgi:hypothetical protein
MNKTREVNCFSPTGTALGAFVEEAGKSVLIALF